MYKGYNVIRVFLTLMFLLGFVGGILFSSYGDPSYFKEPTDYIVGYIVGPIFLGCALIFIGFILMAILVTIVEFHEWLKKEY